jgi:predicted methyltransferase
MFMRHQVMMAALVTALVGGLATGQAIAQEKSVNPGINKQFEKPNPTEFIGRFEKEGRDVFDHRAKIVAACELKPGMVVADIGAGTGLFTRMFSPAVGPHGKVFSVDIADEFVKHVERTAKEQKLTNIVGVVTKPDEVNLPAESVDLAFICDTYHHFEFPARTMKSLHRTLKPGGKVILIDFHRIPGTSSDWVLGHVRAGQEVFVSEIIAAGFKQIDEKKELLKESYFVRFEKVKQ